MGLGVSFIVVVVLSRLLTPEEIGIFSVSAVVVALVQTLRDFGVGTYVIQEKDLTEARVRTAYGVSLAISWLIAALLVLSSPFVAAFYDEPDMQGVLCVLAIGPLLIPFAALAQSFLQREMQFGQLTKVGLTGSLVQAATTLTLAYAGASYYSMAWGSVAGNLATIAALLLVKARYVFLIPSFSEWRSVVSFGSIVSLTQIISRLGRMAPDLIMGRTLGFSAVGFYSRGNGLPKMFAEGVEAAVRPVLLPAFAKQHRQHADLKTGYLHGLSLLTALAWPFYAVAGLMAGPVIEALYGDQWGPAVPVAQILCVSAAIYALFTFGGPALVAMGRVTQVLWTNVIVQSCRIALVAVAAFYSMEWVAAAQILTNVIGFAVIHYFLAQAIGLTLTDVAVSVWQSAGVALAALAWPLFVVAQLDLTTTSVWIQLLIAGAGAGPAWLAAIFALNHPIKQELMRILRQMNLAIAQGKG